LVDADVLKNAHPGQSFKVLIPFRGLKKGDILVVLSNEKTQQDKDFTFEEIKCLVKGTERTLNLTPNQTTAAYLSRL